MTYTPLDSSILTSTLLKEGPDVVAAWILCLAATDRLGMSNMTPTAAASALRISDERAETAFAILCAQDPKSRNREHDGRRLIPQEDGRYYVVSHQKYTWLASRAAASERQRRYEERLRDSNRKGSAAQAHERRCTRCERVAVAEKGTEPLCSEHLFQEDP